MISLKNKKNIEDINKRIYFYNQRYNSYFKNKLNTMQ